MKKFKQLSEYWKPDWFCATDTISMLLLLWLVCPSVSVNIVFSYLNEQSYFLQFYHMGLSDCKVACEIRPRCRTVSFNRRSQSCRLHEGWISNSVPNTGQAHRKEPGYNLYLDEAWKNKSSECGINDCSLQETCDQLGSSICTIKECERLIDITSNVHGNIQGIGATAKVICKSGYMFPDANNTKAITCGTSGIWTSTDDHDQHTPFCVPEPTTTTTTTTTSTMATTTIKMTTTQAQPQWTPSSGEDDD